MQVTVRACVELVGSEAATLKFKLYKTSFAMAQLLQECRPIAEEYDRQRQEALLAASKRDEEGKPVQTKEGNTVFLSEEAEKDFRESIRQRLAVGVTIHFTPFKVDDLEAEGASAISYFALGPFAEK